MSKLEEFLKILEKLWNGQGPIYWFDRHFGNLCIEKLFEVLNNFNGPKELKIITDLPIIKDDTYQLFEKIQPKLGKKEITICFKVLIDQKESRKRHDRWILSEEAGFNIMPFSAIIAEKEGRFSQLEPNEVEKQLKDFQFLWSKSLDILTSFDKIQKEAANLVWQRSIKNVIYANLGEPIKNIIQKILDRDISQLPVKNEKGEIIGAITEGILNRLLAAGEANVNESLELKHIAPPFPILEEKDFDEFLKIADLLYYYPAVLLKKGDRISIITRADILKFWRSKTI